MAMERKDINGLDREQVRQVIINIGKPTPSRTLMPNVPTRTLVLAGLLALTILLGLGSLGAWGAEAGTVKKGRGGLRADQITPLEKSKNSLHLAPLASPEIGSPLPGRTLSNFFQDFPGPDAPDQPRHPLVAPEPLTLTRPIDLLIVLAAALAALLWIDMRLGRRL